MLKRFDGRNGVDTPEEFKNLVQTRSVMEYIFDFKALNLWKEMYFWEEFCETFSKKFDIRNGVDLIWKVFPTFYEI